MESTPDPYSTRTSELTGYTELVYDGQTIGRFPSETWGVYIKNVLNGHEVGWPEPKDDDGE